MTFKTLAQRQQEAFKAPFELPLDEDGTKIVVEQPSANQMIAVDQVLDGMEKFKILVGETTYERLLEATGPLPWGVLEGIMNDIRDHFDLGKSSESSI